MFRSILKWALILILAGVAAAAVALYYASHRVVTQGEFLGLKIGETKEEVFLRLATIQNVLAVEPRVTEDTVVSRDNIEDLSKLASHEAFSVSGPKTGIRIWINDGFVSKIDAAYAGWQMSDVKVGDTVAHALSATKEFILSGPKNRAFATLQNSRKVLAQEGIVAKGNPEFAWLAQYDRWFYKEQDRFTAIELFFKGGYLVKIDFTNYFAG